MCHEQELLEALRHVLLHPNDTEWARALIERIDAEEEAVSRWRDPHGDDWHG